MSHPVVVIGAGGHAKVLIDILVLGGIQVLGVTDPNTDRAGEMLSGVSILGSDQALMEFEPESLRLVNGIGSTADTRLRQSVFEHLTDKGYRFDVAVHPKAIVAQEVMLGEGAQVMAGAIIQPGVRVGVNCIINTGAVVDHDCVIGDHVHVAPGAVLSGNVSIGDGSHIGCGGTVMQSIQIGAGSVIGAGAVVTMNVDDEDTVTGVPARSLDRRKEAE
jgi:UDP-perosamine 4-acetyltransferase